MRKAVWVDAGIRRTCLLFLCVCPLVGSVRVASVRASTSAPPLLDVTRLCDAATHHNVTAMSECVVAESEARSEILQKWDRISDESAQKCVKASRKAKRFPYSVMAKCLATETPLPPPTPVPAPAPAAADGGKRSILEFWKN